MPTMPEATAALDIRSLNTKFNEMVKFIQSAAGDELAIHKVEEILWRQMLRMGMRPCPCLSIAVTPGEILLAVAEAESDGPPGDAVSASQGYGNFSKTGVRLLNPFAE